ncbi:type 4a pilus biogenesis protein PilO [Candidatus Woesebacteria bacterium]|nr:type 4a pilus biogenesis protein PilO [Candidatus Woesebacteria bacterium]QQG47946.1 MAG: type 4a pilus biogenesis protein PilO [Candidatus Woesebacteria bacterium]
MKINFLKKTPLLLIGDILAIIALIVIFVKLEGIANQIQKTRTELLRYTPVNTEAVKTELEKIKDQENILKSTFPKEIALADFINNVSNLKSDNILKNFSFPSDDVVKDKTGFSILPVIFNFQGSMADINASLKKLNGLPYLIRSVDYKLTINEASNSATLDYGGFLYADENFKN